MTTFAQVIERTRRRLMTSQREPINVLGSAVTAAGTSFTLSHSVRFIEGVRLSVDLEDVHVVSVGSSSSTCTVIRGIDGSTAAAHTADTVVRISPTWSNWDIAQAVNDELSALSSPVNGLFRVQSTDFDFEAATRGYNLSGLTDFLDVWRVRYDTPGPEDDWPVIQRRLWRVDNAADTTDFASGTQLVLHAGGYPGQKVRVSYKAKFDHLTDLTDDVENDAGLHSDAHDILSIGAAIRLLSGLEAQRAYSTTQADPRRADEIPPRSASAAIVPLVEQREERIKEEQARLSRLYPETI